MGNIPLQGGASAVDEIDKNLKKVEASRTRHDWEQNENFWIQNQNIGHVQAVFPSDNIITTLYTAVPASVIGILLFFSNTAVGEYSIICEPLRHYVNVRTDFRFIASYCWAKMIDSTVDEMGNFTGVEQNVGHWSRFQYYLFLLW